MTRLLRTMANTAHQLLPGALGALALPVAAMAGTPGVEWVGFERDNARLVAPLTVGLQDNQEKDYAVGDLNNDGWEDLVVARKEPFTTSGRRVNILFMNEYGVLTNQTAQYATASDVAGDVGFLTPTNDRDVVIVDVDLDGWLDVVTATTLSEGQPKHVSHPRVYHNLGNDGGGNWMGLRYEDARFPQLILTGGGPSWPRFCAVDAGDVTGDGYPDLYFGDYDTGGTGGGDMNDRLLVNDGTGHFVDESLIRMSFQMLDSAFGMAVVIADMNGDGANDIVKDTALNAPQYVAVSYNDDGNVGYFDLFDSFHGEAPYHVNVGDLNRDGRLDVVVSDDGLDRYRYNLGTDTFGRVIWGPAKIFDFVSGGDDGFASNNQIVDLNGDDWPDIIICDVDVNASGCNRRAHIYHNPGGNVGEQITLVEEAELLDGSGWMGVVGILPDDLRGMHDVAAFDIDNDGDTDLVFGRCTGTDVWLNQLPPAASGFGSYQITGSGTGLPWCVRIRHCGTTVTASHPGLSVGATQEEFATEIVAMINSAAMCIDCPGEDACDVSASELTGGRFKITFESMSGFTFEVGDGACGSFCTVTAATTCSFNPLITQIDGNALVPGQALCFCDGTHGPVPCGNPAPLGAGCRNSSGTTGTLSGEGSPSVSAADLVLHASGGLPGQPGLFFQGDSAIANGDGAVFGGGQRCCGTNVARLQIVVPDANGDAQTSVNVAAQGGALPGDTRCYQYWYRDPGGACSSSFNLTNGYVVRWVF